MALDFPSSPTNGQIYGNYYYDATVGAWNSFSSTVNPIPSTLKNLSVTTDDIGLVPFTVNGASGQTANLQNWKNSAGTIVASVNNAGVISADTLSLVNDLTVANGGTGAGTFTTGAYLKGNGTSAIQAQTGIPFADVTMQQIGAAADLNTYVTQGLYHQSSNANAAGGANYPVALAGLLEVFQSGADGSGFTYQRYTVYQASHALYERAKYTTTWSAWQQVPIGTVTVSEGGTGATTLTSGAYLKGAGTSAITAQTGIPGGDITSGAVGIAYGGTGSTTGSGLVPIVPSTIVVGSGSYTVSTSGLVTVTNASTLQFRSVFNSTYKNYRIVYRGIASGNLSFFMNLMSGTSVDSSSNYKISVAWFGSRGNNSSSSTAGTSFGGYFGHNRQAWSGDLFAPNLAHRTHLSGMGHAVADSDGATEVHIDGATYAADTVFDGIQFGISGGSFQSATFQLFGYKE